MAVLVAARCSASLRRLKVFYCDLTGLCLFLDGRFVHRETLYHEYSHSVHHACLVQVHHVGGLCEMCDSVVVTLVG
jgi:hypothetical protein